MYVYFLTTSYKEFENSKYVIIPVFFYFQDFL